MAWEADFSDWLDRRRVLAPFARSCDGSIQPHGLPGLEGWRPTARYLEAMATALEKMVQEAMTWPNESRAELADLLVQSLDASSLGATDRLWIVEAKRRREQVRAGSVETIPGEDALRKVRDSVG